MSDVHAAETEVEPQVTEEVTQPNVEPVDGPGSGRSKLRSQLEKNFDTDRKATEAATAKKPIAKTAKRVAGGAEIVGDGAEIVEGTETPTDTEKTTPETTPPEAFSKEAKAEWAKVPPTVQAAILKRETDTTKGVEELKNKYKDIDTALSPHMEAIRKHGHTQGQAISQLFGWFQALAGNPDVAFPALAKSFNYDLAKFAPKPAATPDPAATAAAAGTQPAGTVSPEVQKYIDAVKAEVEQLKQAFGQELTGLKGTFQQQNEAKTNEILMSWAKDKPHFEAVRALMAQLIQSGAVPLKEGQVDLDGAYDRAIWANPEVRTLIQAEQLAAAEKERKAKADAALKKQQEEVTKARKAGVSVGGTAPGEGGITTATGKRGKGHSVRESSMAAREELAS